MAGVVEAVAAVHKARPRRSRPPTEDARERIIDEALHLFALHGLDGMSLQMLAGAVGLHKSSLFHHFSGKDELCRACLDRVMRSIMSVVEPLDMDDATDIETMVGIFESLADHFTAQPTAALFLTRTLIGGHELLYDGEPPDSEQEEPQVRQFFQIVGGWLERARRAGTIRPIRVRHALINLMGLVLFYPSIAAGFGKGLLGFDPTSTRAGNARREELGQMVRAALAPEQTSNSVPA